MVRKRNQPRDESLASSSRWDALIDDPIMEPTEATPIVRGFGRSLLGIGNDYFVGLMLVNVLVAFQVFLGVVLGLIIGAAAHTSGLLFLVLLVAGGGISGAPAFAGLFAYLCSAADPDTRTTIRDYVQGMQVYAVRAWILLLLQWTTGLLLFINLRFYGSLHGTLIALPLTAVILLILLLWAMAGFYVWPLLVRELSWRMLFRNALFIALAAPFSTIGLLLGLSVLSTLLIFSRVLWILFLFSAWALVENVALARLVRLFRERQLAQDRLTADDSQLER